MIDRTGTGAARRLAICVICGSSLGNDEAYASAARELGSLIADGHYDLVFGGGDTGLMGIVARSARDAGGRVIGITLDSLQANEPPLADIAELHSMEDIQARKLEMLRRSDGFVALPGGLGSLDELLDAQTTRLLGSHSKPIVVINIGGFYDLFLAHLKRATERGFSTAAIEGLVDVVDSPKEAMALFDLSLKTGPKEK